MRLLSFARSVAENFAKDVSGDIARSISGNSQYHIDTPFFSQKTFKNDFSISILKSKKIPCSIRSTFDDFDNNSIWQEKGNYSFIKYFICKFCIWTAIRVGKKSNMDK